MLKVFIVYASQYVEDGYGFFAAADAAAAVQLYLAGCDNVERSWYGVGGGSVSEIVGAFADGLPRELDIT